RVTRACGLVGISRSLYRYRSRRAPCEALRERIIELAAEKRRYGYRRIHVLLRREGWEINWKKTYRLYREAGLAVRRRKRKRVGPFERRPLPKPTTTNESWSMDFVSDWLADGRRLRGLRLSTTAAASVRRSRSTPRSRELAWSLCSSGSPTTAAFLPPLLWITARSLRAKRWMPGRMLAASSCLSSARASRSRTPMSRASTRGSETNA